MADADVHLVLPLDLGGTGPRVVVKDVIDIAGHPTCAGSRAFAERAPADANAAVVQRILDAGCRIVGKANLHELAFGMTGINRWTGTPINPHYPHLVPGGSSSGAATAVAAGLCDWALGTDTGGSIRVPAACCGIVGLKPTFGRVSRDGLTPEWSSLDCVGPLARDVGGIVAAMAAIDPAFRFDPDFRVPRIGIVNVAAEAFAVDAVSAALLRTRCEVAIVSLPGLDAAFEAAMTIMNAEMYAAFGHLVEAGGLGSDVESRLRRAALITASAVCDANEVRAAFCREVDDVLARDGLDVLAMPTLPGPPVSVAEAEDSAAALSMSRLCRPFNLSGHPALTLPIAELGKTPRSMQLVGAKDDDARLCATALWIEQRVVR